MIARITLFAILLLGAACSEPTAQADSPVAALGRPTPDFVLRDTDGKEHKLSQLRGKTVVLEWFNPDCPFVKSAHGKGPLKTLAAARASDGLVWLSVNSSAAGKQGHGAERNRAAKAEFAMKNPVLLDESGAVGRSYGAIKTPHLFIIDDKGVLVYRGGLDNAPMGIVDDARPRPKSAAPNTLVSYVESALDALAKQQPIPFADTPPYGCSVKYGD